MEPKSKKTLTEPEILTMPAECADHGQTFNCNYHSADLISPPEQYSAIAIIMSITIVH